MLLVQCLIDLEDQEYLRRALAKLQPECADDANKWSGATIEYDWEKVGELQVLHFYMFGLIAGES